MVIDKNPGVYLEETITNTPIGVPDEIPCFIVNTATAISEIDGKLTRFNNLTAFNTVVEGKGLAKTSAYIEDYFKEKGTDEVFYVYSVKAYTNDGFKAPLIETLIKTEIKEYHYFQETKTSLALNNIITALKEAVNSLANNAHLARVFIVPYADIEDAISKQDEGADSKDTAVTSTINISKDINSGRVNIVFPDDYGGLIAGKCSRTPYNEDVGLAYIDNVVVPRFALTSVDILNLTNAGVLVLSEKNLNNLVYYRINLGVTTNFAVNGADGYLISRTIADEVLNDVIAVAEGYVKTKESENSITFLNSEIQQILTTYLNNQDLKDGSTLTAKAGAVPYTIDIVGTLVPARCNTYINIQTTLN